MIRFKPVLSRTLHYLLLLLIALVFAATFYFSINPVVTESTEFDAACFHVIGSSILQGKMPYLNFIDNKGPVQYFIYAFTALAFDFPWGIFIFSTVLLFVSLILLKEICKRLRIPHAFWILPLYLFFYVCVCSSGGLTEDISLPLTLGAFLVYLDFDDQLRQGKLRFSAGFVMGLLFWICCFTRINNALSIGLITASMGVQLLLKKEFKKTAVLVGSFAAGTVLVVLPIVLWLHQHGAFQEFLNQFLLNNFKYGASDKALSKVDMFFHDPFGYSLFLLTGLGLLGTAIFRLRCGKNNRPLIITTIVVLLGTALSFVSMTQTFPHYRLVLLVPAFFGFILQYARPAELPKTNRKYQFLLLFTTVLCVFGMVFGFSGKMKVLDGLSYAKNVSISILKGRVFQRTETEQEIDRLAANIPDDERDSVFSLEADPKFYAFTGIIPAKRMFVCQELFTDISDSYQKEFISYFSDDPPKWLVTEKPLEELDICGTQGMLLANYRLVDEDSMFHLYERSETNETH